MKCPTGAPVIWAQEIKDIELRHVGAVDPGDLREPVGALFREQTTDLFAVLGQDVRGPLLRRLDTRPAFRPA